MSGATSEHIAFQVETERILQILSSEIYDSPNALIRENVQNAYDAILMRRTLENGNFDDYRVNITVSGNQLIVEDDGIGMTDAVLRENFWKAGSSGKKSDLAQRSGVIGTFGIGAMANFGVCTSLRVETRHVDSDTTLISTAIRSELQIGQDCITLDRSITDRSPGTTVTAELDASYQISETSVRTYLEPYVKFLPIAVYVNESLISQQSFKDALAERSAEFVTHSSRRISDGNFSGTLSTSINSQGQVLAQFSEITLNQVPVNGDMVLIQKGGQMMGFRSFFGLAPIPVSGIYEFGGIANLGILKPTAGREALSRESIQHVSKIVSMIETEVTVDLAESDAADKNTAFHQYVVSHGPIELAKNVTVNVLPNADDVALSKLVEYQQTKQMLYYTGRESTIMQRFGSEQSNLVHISQANPRRKLQMQYIQQRIKLSEVPERTIVDLIPSTQLIIEEAMLLLKVKSVLIDDYLMANTDLSFATISHEVSIHVENIEPDGVRISIARNTPAVEAMVECYKTAPDVFNGFVKDYVREHIYPHIRDYVPSSTKEGRDALYRRLKENKELFRYEVSEFGDLESLLAEYLSGKTNLGEVLRASTGRVSSQTQIVRSDQIGTFEEELPDIIGDVPPADDSIKYGEFDVSPPILRPEIPSRMKILTVAGKYEQLNTFQMFLGLSDRLFRTEGEFLRWPHTTKIIWAVHRVIYIFTDASGGLSLYYDIELKEPLETIAGGSVLRTTTIITGNRIYVPVPHDLESAFHIEEGAKEFYVRFDTIP